MLAIHPTPKHELKGAFLAALAPGERVTGFFVVKDSILRDTRDGNRKFLDLTLADRSGAMKGRVWENAEEVAGSFAIGDIVKLAGDVERYKDEAQLIIHKLRQAESDEYDLADFLPATDQDPAKLLARAKAVIDQMTNPHLAALARNFYDDPAFAVQIQQAPASAQGHHAYLGGLIEHITEALALAKTVLGLWPFDADLLHAGLLLAGIGKTRAYEWMTSIQSSREGELLGPIVLSLEMVSAAIATLPDFPADLALRMKHLIVAQNGRSEWGSPRRPQTLEAVALHHLLDLAAQTNRFASGLAGINPGDVWTEPDQSLGRAWHSAQSLMTHSMPH